MSLIKQAIGLLNWLASDMEWIPTLCFVGVVNVSIAWKLEGRVLCIAIRSGGTSTDTVRPTPLP